MVLREYVQPETEVLKIEIENTILSDGEKSINRRVFEEGQEGGEF